MLLGRETPLRVYTVTLMDSVELLLKGVQLHPPHVVLKGY